MAKKKTKRTPGKKVIRRSHAKKAVRRGGAGGARGNAEVTRAVDLLKWVHQMSGSLMAGFADDQLTAQPFRTDNHLLWQMGHMAMTYAWFASMLDGKPVGMDERYSKLFGTGSRPTADASAYPSFEELRHAYADQFDRFTRAASRMSDADGLGAPMAESGGFVKNKLDAVYKCIWHEGWHQGQISGLRRAFGLPSVM